MSRVIPGLNGKILRRVHPQYDYEGVAIVIAHTEGVSR